MSLPAKCAGRDKNIAVQVKLIKAENKILNIHWHTVAILLSFLTQKK